MPNVLAFALTGLFIHHLYDHTWLVLLGAPFVMLFSFIMIIAIFRLCLPALKPGRYKRELSKPVVAWFCHFALGRAAKLSGLIRFLQALNMTKFLYWRALGAKVSFNIVCSYDIDFVDAPLISIAKGVTLGSETSISCHSDVGSCLMLNRVTIEEDVFIAASTTIGPNTTIKKGAWIGYGNALVNEVIEQGQKLKNHKTEVNK